MNPQKLFNYLLQNLETSMNVCILWDMCVILRKMQNKVSTLEQQIWYYNLLHEIEEIIKRNTQ